MSEALELLSGLVLEDGRRWGQVATDWQRADAAAVLGATSAEDVRRFYSTRPRGGSKTTDLAGIATAVLLTQAPAGGWSYAYATDRDQARLLLNAVRGFVRRTGLEGVLEVQASRVVAKNTGAVFAAEASDEASAWGTLPVLTIVDELGQWPATSNARGLWDAIVSALPKRPTSRLVLLTSAGDPAHWSHKVLEAAKGDPSRWRVSEVPGPLPWVDPADLAEQQRLLRPSVYARLHLNRWTAAEDRLVNAADLAACVTLDGPQDACGGVRYVMSLDVGLTNDRTVATVCHSDGGTVTLDRLGRWEGTRDRPVRLAEVEGWLVEAWRRFGRPTLVVDPYQAVGLAQRLRRQGLRVVEFTFSAQSVGRLAGTLYQLLRERRLALPDDPVLLDELAHVRLRETSPGQVRMDHDSDRHDDHAVALALAAFHLEQASALLQRAVSRRIYSNRGDLTRTGRSRAGLSPAARSRLRSVDYRSKQPPRR